MSSPSLPTSYASLPFQHILVAHHPASSPSPTPVILITLNRPAAHNAFTDTMASELCSLFPMLSLDPRVKAIVVTGHPSSRSFCAGADLSGPGLAYPNETVQTHRDRGGQLALAIHHCTKPIIGAINGSAVGVGITMCLPMNIRIASTSAKIGFVFARRGIVMEAASSFFLPRLIGMSRALHLITTGEVLPSTSPLLSELFSEIVPTEHVLPRALALAETIATSTSSVSTHLMKSLMYRNPGSAEATHLLDSKVIIDLFQSRDKAEGIQSFLEKREPVFKGTLENDAPSVYPWWSPIETQAPHNLDETKQTLESRISQSKAKL